ncbi:hypothetical protein quinque_007008 [Culex quinquefasciatus]
MNSFRYLVSASSLCEREPPRPRNEPGRSRTNRASGHGKPDAGRGPVRGRTRMVAMREGRVPVGGGAGIDDGHE